MGHCRRRERSNQPVLFKIFIPSFSVHVLIACVLLPLLLKNLRGHSKGFFIFQQVAVVLYLLFTFLESLIDLHMSFEPPKMNEFKISYKLNLTTNVSLTTNQSLTLQNGLQKLLNFASFAKQSIDQNNQIPAKFSYMWDSLRNIFFYQQAMFSILQSLHYRAMICDSLHFEEYRKTIFRRLIFVVTCSLFLSFPHLVFLGLELSRTEPVATFEFVKRSYKQVMYLFDMTGMATMKVTSIVIMVFAAYSVKNALNQSEEIRDQRTDRSSLPPLFIVVCLVPLFNNFLFLFGDVPRFILYLVHYLVGKWKFSSCLDHNSFFSVNILLPLNFLVYCLGSLLQCFAFLYYFPNLRKTLCFTGCH